MGTPSCAGIMLKLAESFFPSALMLIVAIVESKYVKA